MILVQIKMAVIPVQNISLFELSEDGMDMDIWIKSNSECVKTFRFASKTEGQRAFLHVLEKMQSLV